MECSYCAKKIAEGIHFCPYCGKEQPQALNNDEIKKNPYKILQVSEDAEREVIDAAYRSLARKYHPDSGTSSVSEERMREINWAHGILSDPDNLTEWKMKNGRKQTAKPSTKVQPSPIKKPTPVNERQSPPVSNPLPKSSAKVQPPPIKKPTPVNERQSPPVSKPPQASSTDINPKRPSNTGTPWGWIFAIVAFFVFICMMVVVFSGGIALSNFHTSTPTPTRRPTNSYIPSPIPTIIMPTKTPGRGDVIYFDDFSNINSGWSRKIIDAGTLDYGNGKYQIYISNPNNIITSSPYVVLPNDVRIEVDATMVASPRNSDFGIACRYVDVHNYYFFSITNNGYAAIGKMKDAGGGTFHDYIFKSSVHQDNALNHIRADCIGNKLTLYINGEIALTEVDSDLTSGSAALMAGTYSLSGTDVVFDNFYVFLP